MSELTKVTTTTPRVPEGTPIVDPSAPMGVRINTPTVAPTVTPPADPLSLTPETPTTPKVDPGAPVTPETPAETPVVPSTVLSDADIEAFTNEVVTTGALSDASLKALKDRGIPEGFAVKYVEGQKAIAAQRTQALLAPIGGQEAFDGMKAWAQSNLSVAEKNSFQKTLESGDDAAISQALSGIHAQYKSAVGNAPRQIRGQASGGGPVPFRDFSELTAAQSDPRYHTSEAYREDVTRRLSVSNI